MKMKANSTRVVRVELLLLLEEVLPVLVLQILHPKFILDTFLLEPILIRRKARPKSFL